MCSTVNGAASSKILFRALLMSVLLADPDADILNRIDACSGTMHWNQEGVIKRVQKLYSARTGETLKAFVISPGHGDAFIAQNVVLVEQEQMAQKLFRYEAALVQRLPSISTTGRSVKQFKATKTLTLDAADALDVHARCLKDAKPRICKCGREGGCRCDQVVTVVFQEFRCGNGTATGYIFAALMSGIANS